jgi:hypothetical protein
MEPSSSSPDYRPSEPHVIEIGPSAYWQSVGGDVTSSWFVKFTNYTRLHVAAYLRDTEEVRKTLEAGADVGAFCGEIVFYCGSEESTKWRYLDVNALHIAVSGEEIGGVPEGGNEQARAEGRECVKLLVQAAAGKKSIVNAHAGKLQWWYRGGPFTELDGVTPLQTAMFFQTSLETGRGKEDAEDLVVVGRADTEKIKCRCIMDDASDLADGWLYQVKRTARELAKEWEIDLPKGNADDDDEEDAFTIALASEADRERGDGL